MNIMIDYDKTYTADVALWREVIDLMRFYGHKVYLVTSRSMDTPIDLWRDFADRHISIIYCNFKAKRDVCESIGVSIDIWIDDDPEWITKDITYDPTRGKTKEPDYTELSLMGKFKVDKIEDNVITEVSIWGPTIKDA